MIRPARIPSLAVLVALALPVLAGCGGSNGGGSQASSQKQPSDAEVQQFLASTGKDAEALGQKVASAYGKTKAYPTSADGLVALGAGNSVGSYKPTAANATLCVEHKVSGKAWAFTSYYVDASAKPVRVHKSATGSNTGCL